VSVSAEQAFKVAYNYALKSILESMDEEPSESLQLLLDEAQTALKAQEAY